MFVWAGNKLWTAVRQFGGWNMLLKLFPVSQMFALNCSNLSGGGWTLWHSMYLLWWNWLGRILLAVWTCWSFQCGWQNCLVQTGPKLQEACNLSVNSPRVIMQSQALLSETSGLQSYLVWMYYWAISKRISRTIYYLNMGVPPYLC